MADRMVLDVSSRTAKGKGENRRLRQQGVVPGIFYTKGENVMVQMPQLPLLKIFEQVGTSNLFDLRIEKGKTCPALIKELVFHPFKRQVQHVDFFGIDMTRTLRIMTPVVITGEESSPGVDLGGVVDIIRDHLEIECLPTDIPECITVDISAMDLNETINIEDISVPEGVTVLFEENFAVIGLALPVVTEEEEAEGEDGAEETEAAEAAEEEAQ